MKHIPNILSGLRILLIPFLVREYHVGNTTNAAIILAASGLTDMLDGYLARRYNWVTQLGKVLDPAADKLTLIAVSIVLMIKLKEYRIVFIIILLKDLIMLVIGGNLLRHGVKIEGAKIFGKVATAAFYIVMVSVALFPDIPPKMLTTLFTIVVVLEVVSALSYIPELKRYRKEKHEALSA